MLNEQQVFDKVAEHLLTQNKQAVIFDGGEPHCKYRLGELRCAIGCLIPDSIYVSNMEGRRASSLLDDFEAVRELFSPDVHEFFLNDLQDIHDNHDPGEWKSLLYTFAAKSKLDSKILEKY